MNKTKGHRCCAKVYHQGGWHSYPCDRTGPREHEGKHYCWQHDPKAIAAKAKAKHEAYLRARAKNQGIMEEGKSLVKDLGCGNVVLSRNSFEPTRRISITFREAKRLAERLNK